MRLLHHSTRSIVLAASALAVTATVSVTTAIPAAAAESRPGTSAAVTAPAPAPPPGFGVEVPVWGNLAVHAFPSVWAPIVEIIRGPARVRLACWTYAELVHEGGYASNVWYRLGPDRGWVSAVQLDYVGSHPIPGVPQC